MSTLTSSSIVAAAGGSFLLDSRTPAEIFTPEDLNEEQRQIAATAIQFAREEILPAAEAIEAKEPGVLKGILQKAAGLGFTSVDIPEEYGGMGMDKITSTLVSDRLSVLASFSTAFGAHIGIATLPLVWYGTEEQKQRYLPKLASAELRVGRDECANTGHAFRGWERVHPERREDVDYELRDRQLVYGFREDRRREVFRVSD